MDVNLLLPNLHSNLTRKIVLMPRKFACELKNYFHHFVLNIFLSEYPGLHSSSYLTLPSSLCFLLLLFTTGRCGEEVLSAQSSEHKSSCQAVEVHCPQEHFGCTFKDQRGYLNQHLGSCHFEAVKPTLHKLVRYFRSWKEKKINKYAIKFLILMLHFQLPEFILF